MRGRFITLEGGEGAGKTTLIQALAEKLRGRGLDVIVTREPGGTPGAEVLREILLTGSTDRWSPMTEALLMYAARVDHVERLIAPALQRGAWVLSDRFADSTTAYQGAAGGVPIERIKALHQAALGNFKPDLTLILDVNPTTGIERTIARGEDATRFERFDPGFHGRLRRAFLDIADDEPDRCIVIDGNEAADIVFSHAVSAIDEHLGARLL
ncbi:thymidylate kinase [Maricaulis salignorans]|uniref:Thymidylate kinase n=2 Tax=Maricaulis salignorans TaxID=144026 RepID=A0A1G9P210_9PROT|nr:thymidylate kinase [Maricaulis salignorans]